MLGSVRERRVVIWKRTWSSVASERAIFFSSFDTEMVQPALVRTEKELALRADYRRRAMKAHAARAAKRTESASLKRRASLPQNRTLGCGVRAQSHAQLQDLIHAAQHAIVLAGSRLLAVERALQEQARQDIAVERALQEQARQDMRALREQARQDMRAGEQVIAYPGEASTAQPCLQDLFDNWDEEKNGISVAEAAPGRQASGRWAWLSSVTAQNSAERSLVTSFRRTWLGITEPPGAFCRNYGKLRRFCVSFVITKKKVVTKKRSPL